MIAFLTGVVSFISPCIIPMIMVYLSTVTGFSFEELLKMKSGRNDSRNNKTRVHTHILLRTAVFVLSFAIVFTAVGGIAAGISSILPGFFSAMSMIAGVLFILLALYYFGLIKPIVLSFGSMLDKERIDELTARWKDADGSLSYAGVFVVGLLFALICSHCISPTLFPTVLLAASTGSALDGMTIMLAFSLGLGLAFMVAALFLSEVLEKLRWIRGHRREVYFVIGTIFLLFGLLFLAGKYLDFVSLLYKIVPWQSQGM